ncbi:MAG: carboxypeptidase regulatory-like domain-containing protein [Acidobacteria bacterium]|nr:carboxypeptidase regulatory-like domain-containing protein [Acidobacteriota bacterium]
MRTRRAMLAALCLPAMLVADDPQMTSITVEVKNLDGKPVERASVVVRFNEGRSVKKFGKKTILNWELRTNQIGVAKIPPIPQGKILVMVIAKGYQTFGETIEIVEPERTVEVKLKPPQPQFSAH